MSTAISRDFLKCSNDFNVRVQKSFEKSQKKKIIKYEFIDNIKNNEFVFIFIC